MEQHPFQLPPLFYLSVNKVKTWLASRHVFRRGTFAKRQKGFTYPDLAGREKIGHIKENVCPAFSATIPVLDRHVNQCVRSRETSILELRNGIVLIQTHIF